MKTTSSRWPVLTQYDQQHLGRIALPLGGIGTGTVGLGGRGDLRDWEVGNRPAKGFKPGNTFFALYAKPAGGSAVTRALEGVIDPRDYEGAFGSAMANHSLPRFRKCAFEAAYPFGQVALSDPDVPVSVRLQAFNPLIPADADRSGIPVAVLRFVVTNKTDKKVAVSICGNLENFIGQDGSGSVVGAVNRDTTEGQGNWNEFRQSEQVQKVGKVHKVEPSKPYELSELSQPISGLLMRSRSIPGDAAQWGTLALTTTAKQVTYRTTWANLSWGDSLLDYWDDFSEDGKLDERTANVRNPTGSLAASLTLAPRSTQEITFLLTWHFPNRQGWDVRAGSAPGSGARDTTDRVGNFYTTQYKDAWDVAERVAAQLPQLEADTLRFVNAFVSSDLPASVKEAALYNASTLRSQTSFRIESGELLGWEGCGDKSGCCFGSCTHVWNYEQTTGFLFGDLARTMREVEFKHSTRSDGLMAFRADLSLSRATEWINAAADGQMGCLMKLYRDWQLSGDDNLLHELWPNARRALEFCWRPGGWDADEDGVMEGCQHNTMDVEYYGPNPQMGTWYLGALRAMEEMARYLALSLRGRGLGEGETSDSLTLFADKCRRLFESGKAWMDTHLFNGDYYEHEIRPPQPNELILPGLQVGMGAVNLEEPDLQLGAGCLVDQLVGQFMAHVCGLGYLLDKKHVQTTLKSIMKYNYKQGFAGHFNHLRSFVLGDESALLMATYPKGRRPRRPFPYFNEVMTGFEYTAGVHMLYEGQHAAGLKVIDSIRARYDGQKRNPFDEAECGHHYARAMAAWAGVLALTGFQYSGVSKTMRFAARDGKHFWSNGYAWGTCEQKSGKAGISVKLSVLGGDLSLSRFVLTGKPEVMLAADKVIQAGESMTIKVGV